MLRLSPIKRWLDVPLCVALQTISYFFMKMNDSWSPKPIPFKKLSIGISQRIQSVSKHPQNRQSPPIATITSNTSMNCSHFIFLRKIPKYANNQTWEYSCFAKKIKVRIFYGREFFSNWEKKWNFEKKWDLRIFFVWELFYGHMAWNQNHTSNYRLAQSTFHPNFPIAFFTILKRLINNSRKSFWQNVL